MQVPEPSREEMIRQIADVLGQANPLPPRSKQITSMLTSILVRTATMAYAIYLAYLFVDKYASGKQAWMIDNLTAGEVVISVATFAVLGYFVFRRVYRDRLVGIDEMLKRTLVRFGVIVLTFLFWSWIASLFNGSGDMSMFVIIASIFIVNSGYDFRLGGKTSKPLAP